VRISFKTFTIIRSYPTFFNPLSTARKPGEAAFDVLGDILGNDVRLPTTAFALMRALLTLSRIMTENWGNANGISQCSADLFLRFAVLHPHPCSAGPFTNACAQYPW